MILASSGFSTLKTMLNNIKQIYHPTEKELQDILNKALAQAFELDVSNVDDRFIKENIRSRALTIDSLIANGASSDQAYYMYASNPKIAQCEDLMD